MKTIFLSSTFVDLEAYRQAAIDTCQRLGLHPIGMEYFNSKGVGATEGCKKELDKADLYIGFYAHRYGYIEDRADGRSVTEIEFDYAGERGLDRLCFVVDPKFAWPQEYIDFKNHDQQEAFKNNKVGKLIRREFTTVDNFAMLLNSALAEWMGIQQGRASGGISAINATHPDDLTEKPDKLFGRDQLLTDVRDLLDEHQRVLLQGFGGMGKTALAATLAASWIKDGKGSVLWLNAGSTESDALFEAIARPFNAQQAIASQTGNAKNKVLRDMLRGCGASLLVLDDCWNNKALFEILKAVPSDMALLVTSRLRYPLHKICSVEELALTDALALLSHHADRDLTSASQATNLCDLLGNHAFAIEIAGKSLKVHKWTPADLIKNIHDAPDKLTMPFELSQLGRENVAKLLEVSLNALDDAASNVFLAFGAFFAFQTTAEMLTRYFTGTPEITNEQLKAIRATNAQLPTEMADNELRQLIQKSILDNLDLEPTQKALDTLHLHGLVERLPATETSIATYRIHDLAYSYSSAQNTDEQHYSAFQACLSYTEHYNEPSLPNFAALRPELENFLGAADWAFKHEHYAEVDRFAHNLYAVSQFLSLQGYIFEAIRLLTNAAEATRLSSNRLSQAAHLGNLGNAYLNLGLYQNSIEKLDLALKIARNSGHHNFECNALSNLGNAYRNLDQVKQAIEYHHEALRIAHKINDKSLEGIALGGLGNDYMNLQQFENAIGYYKDALTIAQVAGDKKYIGKWLTNLGSNYRSLGDLNEAINYYQQALILSREIGNRIDEANILNNLGTSYNDLQDYPRAIDYYLKARTLFVEIGAQHRVATVEDNIIITQSKLDDSNSDASDPSA